MRCHFSLRHVPRSFSPFYYHFRDDLRADYFWLFAAYVSRNGRFRSGFDILWFHMAGTWVWIVRLRSRIDMHWGRWFRYYERRIAIIALNIRDTETYFRGATPMDIATISVTSRRRYFRQEPHAWHWYGYLAKKPRYYILASTALRFLPPTIHRS